MLTYADVCYRMRDECVTNARGLYVQDVAERKGVWGGDVTEGGGVTWRRKEWEEDHCVRQVLTCADVC
jgi:hypothetical protein